jgi:DHA1 family multidrug resistance protein-like MFS transporter
MIGWFQTRLLGLPDWQRTLWIMFFAQLVTAVGFSIIFPFLPLYVEDLGTNTGLSIEFWAGMVFSAQAVTMMIASPIWGGLADRFGRKVMVERSMFGGAIIICLMAFPRTAEELVLLRAVQGLITGTVSAANALVAASAPRQHTGFAMGVIQVGLWGGVALGPLIGGVMADAFGFRVPFIVTAVLLLVAGVLVHLGIKETFTPPVKDEADKRGFIGEWRHILSMSGVAQTYTARFLTGLSRSMVVPIMPLFMAMLILSSHPIPTVLPDLSAFLDARLPVAGAVSTLTGLAVGLASATATASAVVLGRLGDRIGHRTILVGAALASVVFYLPQAFVTAPWHLLALQGLTGLAAGGLVAAPSALLARYTDPGEEGAVYGLDNSVIAAARAVAPLAGAGIAVWLGLRATFGVLSGVFVVVAVVGFVLLPNDHIGEGAADETGEEADAQPQREGAPSAAQAG